MSTRMDRIKQGQAAKERVLSGMYNQPRTTSSARSSRNARMKAHQQKVSESVNNALTKGTNKITDFITSPTVQKIATAITNEVKKNDQIAAKGMTPGLSVTPPTGFLVTNPNVDSSKPFVPNVPVTPKPLPGSDWPVIGPIIKGGDWLQEKTEPFANIAQDFYTPSAGIAATNALYAGTKALVSKVLPASISYGEKLLPTITREAIVNGAMSYPLSFANSLANNPQGGFEAANKQGIQGVAAGGVLGAAAPVVGKVLGSVFSKILSRNNIPEEQIQKVLALPMGSNDAQLARGPRGEAISLPLGRGDAALARRANPVQTPDVIHGNPPAPLALPEGKPLGLPEPNIAPPTTARIAQQVNPYRQQFESLMQRAQEEQAAGRLSPGREDLEVESMWSQMAGPQGITLDELIQRAYPTRPNRVNPDTMAQARQYQAAREVAGAPMPVKSMADRYPQGGQTGIPEMPITVPARAPMQSSRKARIAAASRQPIQPEVAPQQPVKPTVSNQVPKKESLASSVAPISAADESEVAQLIQRTEPRVRDKIYNLLDEAEAAARQRIAKRRGNINSNPLPEWGDMSIIMAAKMGKGTIKLADFTEEAVKEFGEKVRERAPQLYRASKEQLKRHERAASKDGHAADSFNNSGQGDAGSFAKKINYTPAKNKKAFSQKTEKIRSTFVDDIAALEGLEKRVKGRVGSAEDSLYKTARLTRGIPERANQIVQQRLNPLVSAVEKAGYTSDDLGMYALAKHAKDVNAAGYKSGFTNKEIDDVLSKYENVPALEEARQGMVQVSRDMMQELVDSGVVSKELQAVLNDRWQNYIPLFRAFDDEAVGVGRGAADSLANIASPVKALKGSERAVVDPLENLVKNIFQSVNAAERNKVGQQLAKLAETDAEGKFIRKLGPDEQVGRKNVVNVKENGENVKYEVEPEVYQALLNLDNESSNLLINILSKPASLLRAGATLTPEFFARNPMRDVLQAYVTSKSNFNPLIDFPAGFISTITKGKHYQDWINNLGAYGNVVSMDRNVHREALKKVLGEPASKKFVNVVTGRSLIRVLRSISDTMESATKVGEYRAAIRQGQTPQEAAYRARDLMDFARKGSGIKQANKMIAFLNANIQGKSKLLRAIKENPVRVTRKAFTAVTLPSVGIYLYNDKHANETQKNTIEEAPDWLKNSFWLLAVPGTDTVARIPKPFDLAPLFANLPERVMKFVKEKDPEAFDGFARQTLASGAVPYQMTGLVPLIEGMSNYSFFRDGSIIPKREEGLEYKDQYDPVRTTETAKVIARLADAVTGGKGPFKNFSSPRIVDNTLQGVAAGLGTYATSAVDTILQGKFFGKQLYDSLVDRPVAPSKQLEQMPFAKAFTVDPYNTSRSLDELYTEKDALTRQSGSAKLNDTEFGESHRLKELNTAAKRIGKIGKEIREIEQNGELSPDQKRRMIEPLLQERNALARQTMQRGG